MNVLACFMLAFLIKYCLADALTTRITAIFCYRVICVLFYLIECQIRRRDFEGIGVILGALLDQPIRVTSQKESYDLKYKCLVPWML